MNYVLAAVHTKWPACQIYIMRPWRRGEAADCNTLATWIADIVALLDYAHEGPDERVFLENGDDGATYTSDGIHPNEAGSALTAQQWRTLLCIA
jgi:lysophospholipase L1-like esterase